MAITKSNPAGSRATRLQIDPVAGNVTSTQWQINPVADGGTFIITTTASGSTSGNVLAADLDTLDIWLPPSHEYTIRTRHILNTSAKTGWSARTEFTSRGPLNSYQKYLALSGISGVDNIDI